MVFGHVRDQVDWIQCITKCLILIVAVDILIRRFLVFVIPHVNIYWTSYFINKRDVFHINIEFSLIYKMRFWEIWGSNCNNLYIFLGGGGGWHDHDYILAIWMISDVKLCNTRLDTASSYIVQIHAPFRSRTLGLGASAFFLRLGGVLAPQILSLVSIQIA